MDYQSRSQSPCPSCMQKVIPAELYHRLQVTASAQDPQHDEEIIEMMADLGTMMKTTDEAEMWRFMASRTYGNMDPVTLCLREVLQNSDDAIRDQIRLGKMTSGFLKVSAEETGSGFARLTMEDNGGGMTREILSEKYLGLGKTGKSGEDVESTGGFGVAKAAIFATASKDRWALETQGLRIQSVPGTMKMTVEDHAWTGGVKLIMEDVIWKQMKGFPYPGGYEHSPRDRSRRFLALCNLPQTRLSYDGDVVNPLFPARGGTHIGEGWNRHPEIIDLTVRHYHGMDDVDSTLSGGIYVRLNGILQFIRTNSQLDYLSDGSCILIDVVLKKKDREGVKINPKHPLYPFDGARNEFTGDYIGIMSKVAGWVSEKYTEYVEEKTAAEIKAGNRRKKPEPDYETFTPEDDASWDPGEDYAATLADLMGDDEMRDAIEASAEAAIDFYEEDRKYKESHPGSGGGIEGGSGGGEGGKPTEEEEAYANWRDTYNAQKGAETEPGTPDSNRTTGGTLDLARVHFGSGGGKMTNEGAESVTNLLNGQKLSPEKARELAKEFAEMQRAAKGSKGTASSDLDPIVKAALIRALNTLREAAGMTPDEFWGGQADEGGGDGSEESGGSWGGPRDGDEDGDEDEGGESGKRYSGPTGFVEGTDRYGDKAIYRVDSKTRIATEDRTGETYYPGDYGYPTINPDKPKEVAGTGFRGEKQRYYLFADGHVIGKDDGRTHYKGDRSYPKLREKKAVIRPKNPLGSLGIYKQHKQFNKRQAAQFKRHIAKWLPYLTIWDLAVKCVIRAGRIRIAPIRVGFILEDTVRALAISDPGKSGPTFGVLIEPFRLKNVVVAHKERPLDIAIYLHTAACHELAHLPHMGDGHSTPHAKEREDLAFATAHTVDAIMRAVIKVFHLASPYEKVDTATKGLQKRIDKLIAERKESRARMAALEEEKKTLSGEVLRIQRIVEGMGPSYGLVRKMRQLVDYGQFREFMTGPGREFLGPEVPPEALLTFLDRHASVMGQKLQAPV